MLELKIDAKIVGALIVRVDEKWGVKLSGRVGLMNVMMIVKENERVHEMDETEMNAM